MSGFPLTPILDTFPGAGDPGSSWLNDMAGFGISKATIVSNQITSPAADYSEIYWSTQFGADQEFFYDIPTKGGNGTEHYMCIRLQSPGTAGVDSYYVVMIPQAGTDIVQVYSIVNQTFTQLGADFTVEFASGDALGASVVGTTITVYRRSAGVWSSLGTRTDSAISGAGFAGGGCSLNTIRLDNFGGGTIPAVTTSAVNDSDLVYSPGNFFFSGSTYAQTNNTGAYMRIAFDGTGVLLGLDLSVLDALSLTDTEYPRLQWRVDGGSWQSWVLVRSQAHIWLASGLSDTEHVVQVWLAAVTIETNDRWSTPSLQLRIRSIDVIDGDLVAAPSYARKVLVFADSLTEGMALRSADYTSIGMDASNTWLQQLAQYYGFEVGAVGFSGQGWTITGDGSVPVFHDAAGNQTWDKLSSGQSRSFTGITDIIVVHGANDGINGANAATVEARAEDFLADFRAAHSDIRVFLLVPFGGQMRTALIDAEDDYQTATPDDLTALIDVSQIDADLLEALDANGAFNGTLSTDGTHPTQVGQDTIFALVRDALEPYFATLQNQTAYQLYAANGSPLADENAAAAIGKNTRLELVIQVDATNDPDAGEYTLQYRKSGVNAWRDVPQ